jgi:hypothetical protein
MMPLVVRSGIEFLAMLGLEKLKEEYLAKVRPQIKDTHPNLTKVLDNSFWVIDALFTADMIRGLFSLKRAWKGATEVGKLGKKLMKEKGMKNKLKGLWELAKSYGYKGMIISHTPLTGLGVAATIGEIKQVGEFDKISEELSALESLKEAKNMEQFLNSEIIKNFNKILEGNVEMGSFLDLQMDYEELQELIEQLEDMNRYEEDLYANYLAEDIASYIYEQLAEREMAQAQTQTIQLLAQMLTEGR